MKERVSQREKTARTLDSVRKSSQQLSLHSILQNYRRENSVSPQTQRVRENTSLQSIQRSVAQLDSRVISLSLIGVPGDTMRGRNNYVGRRINNAYPGQPPREYGFLQNGAVRVTITFPDEMDTDDVQTALENEGLTVGAIREGRGVLT